MYQRSILFVVAFVDGILAWQASWLALAIGLCVALWLVLDDRAIESLDADRSTD